VKVNYLILLSLTRVILSTQSQSWHLQVAPFLVESFSESFNGCVKTKSPAQPSYFRWFSGRHLKFLFCVGNPVCNWNLYYIVLSENNTEKQLNIYIYIYSTYIYQIKIVDSELKQDISKTNLTKYFRNLDFNLQALIRDLNPRKGTVDHFSSVTWSAWGFLLQRQIRINLQN